VIGFQAHINTSDSCPLKIIAFDAGISILASTSISAGFGLGFADAVVVAAVVVLVVVTAAETAVVEVDTAAVEVVLAGAEVVWGVLVSSPFVSLASVFIAGFCAEIRLLIVCSEFIMISY
jgi:hypothetical protein